MDDWVQLGGLVVALFLGLLGAGWFARSESRALQTLNAELEILAKLPTGEPRSNLTAHVETQVVQYLARARRPPRGWDLFHGIVWVGSGTATVVGAFVLSTHGVDNDKPMPAWFFIPALLILALLMVSILQRVWVRFLATD